ncbi:MAG: helix-turn-helix transcriptional regulator [Alphaproteobacteria bacterium]|nr:helix-turn-helix transcriptional regulator [Alphaproteobacteria bacterium]MBR1601799.1 helix-turn-helix transcriptional regulator [Alphaproteobacteria bacterium]
MKRKIGLKIKAIRQNAKITQEVLAEQCGISVEAVSNIERGVNYPHFETLIQIAKILGCSLNDILDDNLDKNISRKRVFEEAALIASIKKLSDDQISTLIKVVDALK